MIRLKYRRDPVSNYLRALREYWSFIKMYRH